MDLSRVKLPLISKLKTRFTGRLANIERFQLEGLWRLQRSILNTLDFNEVVKNSVNSVLVELGYLDLGYRIIVLALLNQEKQVIERVAISQTEEANKALEVTPVPFHEIIVPLTDKENIIVKAIKTGSIYITNNWYDILRPTYTEEEAQKVQRIVGITTSMVYPVVARNQPIGSLIFSMIKDYEKVTEDEKEILYGFTDLVGLAVQHTLLYNTLQNTSNKLKVANEDLEVANNRLKDLDRLKDDFVSVASHELRTPMTAIKSYLYMAINKGDIKLSAKMVRYLTRAYLSTERLINLVNDMLNVSRIEAGRIEIIPKIIDLGFLMEDIVSEIIPKADERGITVNVIKTQIPKVFADPDKVYQIVLNLLGNAVKFTPAGGGITVSFFSDGKTVETSVQDTGVGISPSDISRLFQKFSRLDNSYVAAATSGGTGLGLFISKSLVEMMHGRIGVYSKGVNMGSTFTFSLPAAIPEVVKNASLYTTRLEGEVKKLEPIAI